MVTADKFETFVHPGGFIEQKFIGLQTPNSVRDGVKQLIKYTHKLLSQKKAILILVDISDVPEIHTDESMKEAHKAMIKAMREEAYDRIAVYGDMPAQVLVNTLALIAGKRNKIRVFADRVEALRWLKSSS